MGRNGSCAPRPPPPANNTLLNTFFIFYCIFCTVIFVVFLLLFLMYGVSAFLNGEENNVIVTRPREIYYTPERDDRIDDDDINNEININLGWDAISSAFRDEFDSQPHAVIERHFLEDEIITRGGNSYYDDYDDDDDDYYSLGGKGARRVEYIGSPAGSRTYRSRISPVKRRSKRKASRPKVKVARVY